MFPQSPTDRQKQIAATVRRRELAAMDNTLLKQLLGQWPRPLPDDYLTRTDYYTTYAKTAMVNLERSNPDIETRSLSDKHVVEYNRWKTLRTVLFFRTHPINNLPTDILINIFRLVGWATMDPMVGVQLRLTMTWICRLWRQLVLDDATLWSAVWFRDPPPYERSFAWFDRAGTSPLSVRINDYQPPDRTRNGAESPLSPVPMSGQEMSELLDRVFTKLSQIDIFIVIVDSWQAVTAVMHKLDEAGRQGVQINMRRFELHRSGQPLQWMDGIASVPLFGGAPSPYLNFVAINGVMVDWKRTVLANLTTLDLRRTPLQVSPSTSRFREIMASCPNLHKLVLDGSGPSPGDLAHGLPPVRMDNLHTLVMGDFSCVYAMYILTIFVAPHVRDLTFMNLSGENYSGFFNLMAQGASFPEVKILTLYTVAVAEDTLSELAMRRWFQTMLDVQYLRIAQLPSHLLRYLCLPGLPRALDEGASYAGGAMDEPPAVLLPRCDVIEFQNMECGAVADWVRGRRQLGVPPQSIYINSSFVSTNSAEIEKALRPLGLPLMVAPLGNTTPDEGRIIAEDDRLADV